MLDACSMKSLRFDRTDWTSRKQVAHAFVLATLGTALLLLVLLAVAYSSSKQIKWKFTATSVTRPTIGGQGIYFRRLSDDPSVYPCTYEAWIRVGDFLCDLTIEVPRP